MKYIYIILITIIQINCNTDQKRKENTPFFIPPELSNIDLINSKNVKSWHLRNVDSVITLDSSISFYFPKNGFIDENGKIVDEYYIFITRINSIPEIIHSNLQTLSDTNILETEGMFHIQAVDPVGNKVNFAKNKYIGIERFYKLKESKGYNLYEGNWKDKKINWLQPQLPDNYLVNIDWPSNNFNLNAAFGKVPLDIGGKPHKPYCDTIGKSKELLRSYFATREFITTRLTRSFFENHSYLTIYFENIGENLYEADSLCMVFEKNNRYKWKDRFSYTQEEYIKTGKPLLDVSERLEFYNERLTKPKYINTFDVDLSHPDARIMLKKKGLNEKLIDEAFLIYQRKKKIEETMAQEMKFSDFFQINSFGWFNFDKVLELENGILSNVSVNILNNLEHSELKLFYILNGRKSVIYGKKLNDSLYTIEYSDNAIAKVPKDCKIIILAYCFLEDGVLVGSTLVGKSTKNTISLIKIPKLEFQFWIDKASKF